MITPSLCGSTALRNVILLQYNTKHSSGGKRQIYLVKFSKSGQATAFVYALQVAVAESWMQVIVSEKVMLKFVSNVDGLNGRGGELVHWFIRTIIFNLLELN